MNEEIEVHRGKVTPGKPMALLEIVLRCLEFQFGLTATAKIYVLTPLLSYNILQ